MNGKRRMLNKSFIPLLDVDSTGDNEKGNQTL